MAKRSNRRDNHSVDPSDWTMKHLVHKIELFANLSSFGTSRDELKGHIEQSKSGGDAVRDATRLYRDTWLQPMIDELKLRLDVQD
jgi:hypothetical protein